MKRNTGCQSIDHALSRRHFLAGTTAAGFGAAAAMGGLSSPVVADTLKRDQKRILQVYLQGGVSQLESWDPKPGTEYGGPNTKRAREVIHWKAPGDLLEWASYKPSV